MAPGSHGFLCNRRLRRPSEQKCGRLASGDARLSWSARLLVLDWRTGDRRQAFASLPNSHRWHDRSLADRTPDASSRMPKWIMRPMPNVRFGGLVACSRLVSVAHDVKLPGTK
jgi:hypothetical protein